MKCGADRKFMEWLRVCAHFIPLGGGRGYSASNSLEEAFRRLGVETGVRVLRSVDPTKPGGE